ncbi:MAG: TonB-dependent receptor [Deltaproteobacteria bacterium]|nr:MAG: TonB-dependent receptor [Deltaproteobacteria bacterium]
MDALLGPFMDPGSRTFWGGLVASAAVAGAVWLSGGHASPGRFLAALRHRSTWLDVQLYVGRRLLGLALAGATTGAAFALATHGVRRIDALLGRPELSADPTVIVALYSVCLFVAWDLSRFAVHYAMHRIPALWAIHQVHHSAEVLTPLTFHRIHPLESLVYQLRGLVVTTAMATGFFWLFREAASPWTLLGVHGIGFVLNVASGNLRHSEVWLRFGPAENWLISPAQHQIHHGLGTDDRNFGTWLALWDRLAGTLELAGPEPVAAFGIAPETRNHGDDLLSAWFGPVRDMLGGTRMHAAVAAMLLAAGVARAEEPTPSDEAPSEPATETPTASEEIAPQAPEADTPAPEAAPAPEAPAPDADEPTPDARAVPAPETEVPPPASATEDTALPPEDEPVDDGSDWDDWDSEDLIVYAPDGTPRVAGSAHQVDAETLETWEYDDIEKVVTTVPGITTRGEDGFGLRPNIGIRGVNSDRSAKITLLEDGIPLVPAPYAAPAAYYFPMSTRLVGVEVFKGPAATTHGPQTVGGAINLKTRDVPEGPDGGLDLAMGLRGTYKAHAWGGTGGKRAGILGEVVHLQTAGFKQLDDGGPTGFARTEAMLKGFVQPADGHRVQVKLGFAHESSHETYLGLAMSDYEVNPYRRYAASQLGDMAWNRTQAELSWKADLGAVRVHTVAYHHWLSRDWTKFNRFASGIDTHDLLQADPSGGSAAAYMAILRGEADSLTPEQLLQIGTNHREYHAFGVQTRGRWEVFGEGWSSTLRFGLRVHGDRVYRRHTEEAHAMTGGQLVHAGEDTEVLLDARSSADALAVHVQEDFEVGRLHVLPGSRVEVIQTEQHDVGDSAKSPTLRAVWLPGVGMLAALSDGVDVFAGIHKGFSPVAPGQPAEVDPEVSWNSELGIRAHSGGLHGELTGYVNDYLNLTGQCTISGGCDGALVDLQFNGGRVLVVGLESVVGQTWMLPNGWKLPVEGTYTLTHGRFRSDFVSSFPQFGSVSAGDGLPYVPTHSGSGRIGIETRRLRLGLGATARSGMRDIADSGALDEDDIPALLLLDAAAEAQVLPNLAVYATGTNLTQSTAHTSWRPFGARPTAPLQVMVGLKLSPATR